MQAGKDLWSGVSFVGIGIAVLVVTRDYPVGTAAQMGPGYFPTALSIILIALGGTLLIKPFGSEAPRDFAVRKMAIVLGACLAFGVLLEQAGLLIALAALATGSAAASKYFSWRSAFALTAFLCTLSTVLFVWILGLPIGVLGDWFGK